MEVFSFARIGFAMNDMLDRLIIRVFFTLFTILVLYAYKYAHYFLYPSAKKQLFRKFYPSANSADSLHLFSRLLGLGIVMSSFSFDQAEKVFTSALFFSFTSLLCIIIFLVSIYIMESIVLYNFEYSGEIIKKQNYSYALVSAALSLSVAFIIRTVNIQTQGNVVVFLLLWLLAMVLFGFSTKLYKLLSKLNFYQLLIQKNLAVGLSYGAFVLGCSFTICSVFYQEYDSLENYSLQIILKAILAAIVFPFFRLGIHFVYELKNDWQESELPEWGYGLYEGAVFFLACLFTSLITGHVYFGTIYPVF